MTDTSQLPETRIFNLIFGNRTVLLGSADEIRAVSHKIANWHRAEVASQVLAALSEVENLRSEYVINGQENETVGDLFDIDAIKARYGDTGNKGI